jgi:hypothetical protein
MTHHLIPQDKVSSDATPHLQNQVPSLRLIDGGILDHADHREQLPLALTWQVAPGVPATRPLEVVPTGGTTSSPAAAATSGNIRVFNEEGDLVEVPHPISWAGHMARMVFEVSCGERPSAQLNRWVSRDQLSLLALRGQSYARHPATRAQKGLSRLRKVRGVRAMQVAPGIIEASAVLVGTARSHAIAMRMEAIGNQWMLTAVEMR